MIKNKLNPILFIGLTILGSCLFYWCSYPNSPKYHDLSKSGVFKRIIECSDLVDGNNCFEENRLLLVDEVDFNTPLANQQFSECINMIGTQNDINLMLNIQKCYYQSNSVDNIGNNETKVGKICIVISLIIQIFIAIHSIINYLVKNNDDQQSFTNYTKINRSINQLNDKTDDLARDLKQTKLSINSECRNLQGRLNKGGDIKLDIEAFKQNLVILNGEFNQFKIDFFTRIGKEFMILPPKIGLSVSSSARSGRNSNLMTSNVRSPNVMSPNGRSPNFMSPNLKSPNVMSPNLTSNVMSPDLTSDGRSPNITKMSNTIPNFMSTAMSNLSLVPPKNTSNKDHSGAQNSNSPHTTNSELCPGTNNNRGKVMNKGSGQSSANKENCPGFNLLTQDGRDNFKSFVSTKLKYKDIRKTDDDNKPYKRIFIPGRGWVPLKKFEIEEAKYGADEFIKTPSVE